MSVFFIHATWRMHLISERGFGAWVQQFVRVPLSAHAIRVIH
jgi:hypothetical protein